ncbi:hypothetical protein D3C84_859730 [compost metagenome]
MRVAVVHRVDRLAITAVEIRQQHFQAPGTNVFDGHEMRQAGNALTFQRQVPDRLAAGRADGRLNRPAIAMHITQRPLVEAFIVGEAQQRMPAQVLDHQRCAVLLKVSRAGDDVQRAATQRAGMQGRVGQRADADGDVGALFEQVDDQVVAVEFELDVRVEPAELVDVRHDGVQHERRGGVDPQTPGRGLLT